ncbi:ABC transporter permease [Gelria sp. Kuro-4]|uniref:ABC transporter permease n=1 Tax=Gelria sp. Kuro-4 TaxID=2796927 RepID=UPI001BF0B7BF|nr:ABC transporter permease [Gelria sp. Kuro-4]BCV24592.1 ribose ABC transporter permease [Gelria sp. Kuro-4]
MAKQTIAGTAISPTPSIGARLLSPLQRYGVEMALVLLIVLAGILEPVFLNPVNVINVLRQVSITGTLAVGMTFVIINGGIDLSVGSIVGLAGMLAVMLQPQGLLVSTGVALVIGVTLGFLNGVGVANGIVPFIMTLATMTAARGIAFMVSDGRPVMGVSDAYAWIGEGQLVGIPVPVVVFALVVATGHFILTKTTFGRSVYAVGGNIEAARLSGINVRKNQVMVYVLSGLLAGIAGVVITARMTACDPTVGNMFELDAIAATVIGGTSMSGGEGRVTRTVVGALIMGVLANTMNLMNVSPYSQQVVKGIIILGAVLMDRVRR